MNPGVKVFRNAFIVSMAGFLMGFDSVVISGVNLPVKALWQTSDWFHGTFIISMSLWGMVIGALGGGYPAERFGRKITLISGGLLFSLSALGTASSPDPVVFSIFRFIGGLGAGISSIAAPTYIAEISDPHNRGRRTMLYQFNIVFGIFLAYFSNYLIQKFLGENAWRFMLGIEFLPAFIYFLLLLTIPQSPRWRSQGTNDPVLEKSRSASRKSTRKKWQLLFSKRYRKALILTLLMAFFNQFSGISFILFYAPQIFEQSGLGTSMSLIYSVSIGLINLIFTFLGIQLIDRSGRKPLMYIGSIGYIISLAMVAIGFLLELSPIVLIIFILIFIASHAIGQGAVIWVFIAEIFPDEVRSFGQSWGSGSLNIFAAITTLFGAVLLSSLAPYVIFGIFSVLMVLQLLFTHFLMPETKGLSLEEIDKKLAKKK